MIAGGVGIIPFLSVLRWFRNIRPKNKVTLFWANKSIEDIFAVSELKEMTRDLSLAIIHAISREKDAEKYFQAEYPGIQYMSA